MIQRIKITHIKVYQSTLFRAKQSFGDKNEDLKS